jgi:hypothetical protein
VTASLVRSMRVALKVAGGAGPWYDVLAMAGPSATGAQGFFLIVNPDRDPKLQWVIPGQIEDVKYELAS